MHFLCCNCRETELSIAIIYLLSEDKGISYIIYLVRRKTMLCQGNDKSCKWSKKEKHCAWGYISISSNGLGQWTSRVYCFEVLSQRRSHLHFIFFKGVKNSILWRLWIFILHTSEEFIFQQAFEDYSDGQFPREYSSCFCKVFLLNLFYLSTSI